MMSPMSAIDGYLARRFQPAIFLLVAFYSVLQIAYVAHLPLVMDEFDGAYEAYRLRSALPYRDFIPYKTVAGYYIQTLGTFFSPSVWGHIVAVKLEIVLMSAAMLAAAALYASRIFRRSAVATALLLLVVCSTFLERSSELRVDMLTAWAGLWSLLFLLRGRYIWAGVAAGASFLLSQKGALYIVSGGVAVLVQWLLEDRTRSGVQKLLSFIIASAAPVAAYLLLWGWATSFRSVLEATFLGGVRAAAVAVYDIRAHYWRQILLRDGGYFVLAALGLVRTLSARKVVLFTYAISLLLEALLYNQPWPYFFVLIFPTLFVVHAALFDAVDLKAWAAVVVVVLAVLYPLRRVAIVLHRHNDYQRYNVEVASAVLGPRDPYLAGTDIIHDHEQTLPELSRLGAPMLVELRAAREPVLAGLLFRLDQRPPKLVIGNYRIYGLPRPLLVYLSRNYARLTGSIWCYAPLASSGTGAVSLRFPGRYWIDSKDRVTIDARSYPAGVPVQLSAGKHALSAAAPVRLRLLPAGIESLLDARFMAERDLYPNVYGY